jgi:hypothetical protein
MAEPGIRFGKAYNFIIRSSDETMAPVQLAGAALVLAGVVLVTLKAAR